MASTAEIKGRIESIQETRKITNAMYLIASTKLRRARSELEQTRPYFDALRSEIKRIFRTANDVDSPYFYPPDREPELPGTYGCLVITADKGLAGAYNLNVLKKARKLLADHSDMKLFVVGEYGRRFFTQHVIYTDMENGMNMRARSTRLLPFHRTYFATPEKEKKVAAPFEFQPSVSAVLHGVMHSYLTGFIYSALIDSFCSEQQARMTAMDSANRNAEELLAELSLQYNRVRQAAITQEITEITAGARAQRKKRRKEVQAP